MSYDTYAEGIINVSPPLPAPIQNTLNWWWINETGDRLEIYSEFHQQQYPDNAIQELKRLIDSHPEHTFVGRIRFYGENQEKPDRWDIDCTGRSIYRGRYSYKLEEINLLTDHGWELAVGHTISVLQVDR